MNKKGFTLIELILTICILSIIAVISFVTVTNIIKESKNDNCELIKANIINATKDYISDNRYSGDLEKNMTIYASLLADSPIYLDGNIKHPYNNENINLEKISIKIALNDDYTINEIILVVDGDDQLNNCKSS